MTRYARQVQKQTDLAVIVVPRLSDGVITLTGYTDDDIADHLAGEDEEKHAGSGSGRRNQPKTASETRSGAGQASSWKTGGPTRTFAMRDASTGQLLGGCELRLQSDGSAHISYWTSAGERCRGHATRAFALLLHYGKSIGVTRFEAHIAPDNRASRRVAEKSGFRGTGTFTDEDGALMFQNEQRSSISL